MNGPAAAGAPWLDRSRILTGPLCLFDIVLGGSAVFFPQLYLSLLQPHAQRDCNYLLGRAGMVWLGYAVVQGLAFFRRHSFPEWLVVVAILRLIEVPADLLYAQTGDGLGKFGVFSLYFAPTFNLVAGLLLITWYRRFRRNLA